MTNTLHNFFPRKKNFEVRFWKELWSDSQQSLIIQHNNYFVAKTVVQVNNNFYLFIKHQII